VASARLVKGVRREDLFEAGDSTVEALVVFDGGRSDKPIIIGLLQSDDEAAESLTKPSPLKPAAGNTPAQESVLIEALAELVLKCGVGSLTLRKDGKIVLRGTHLLSRSSGPIRIKGGHVEIN
jgi:hypothetical protein